MFYFIIKQKYELSRITNGVSTVQSESKSSVLSQINKNLEFWKVRLST